MFKDDTHISKISLGTENFSGDCNLAHKIFLCASVAELLLYSIEILTINLMYVLLECFRKILAHIT